MMVLDYDGPLPQRNATDAREVVSDDHGQDKTIDKTQEQRQNADQRPTKGVSSGIQNLFEEQEEEKRATAADDVVVEDFGVDEDLVRRTLELQKREEVQ